MDSGQPSRWKPALRLERGRGERSAQRWRWLRGEEGGLGTAGARGSLPAAAGVEVCGRRC